MDSLVIFYTLVCKINSFIGKVKMSNQEASERILWLVPLEERSYLCHNIVDNIKILSSENYIEIMLCLEMHFGIILELPMEHKSTEDEMVDLHNSYYWRNEDRREFLYLDPLLKEKLYNGIAKVPLFNNEITLWNLQG